MPDLVELKVTGLDGVLDMLQKLPPEVVSKNGGPVRASLRKGAIIIRDQEKENLRAIIARTVDTKEQQSTGLLMDNIIASRGKPPIGSKGERFLVRIRRKVYQRPSNEGGDVSTWKTARLMEYGSSQQPARSFIRSAARSRAQDAINAITKEMNRRLDVIVRKLAK